MSTEEQAASNADGGGQAIDTSQIDANELAKNMAETSDEQLIQLMESPMRGQILTEIFNRMEQHFRADAAGDTEAVIHWRITGGPEGGTDEYETVIKDGACDVHEGLQSDGARVTFTIGGADFLRLVTGNAAGPMLFMSGKLKIEGDMMFAARAASLFTIPSAAAE
ncbi:MAG: SCP2 sterol-binding domain-containing protein [Solirubrobacterales bacterium]